MYWGRVFVHDRIFQHSLMFDWSSPEGLVGGLFMFCPAWSLAGGFLNPCSRSRLILRYSDQIQSTISGFCWVIDLYSLFSDPPQGHRHNFSLSPAGPKTARPDEQKVPEQDSELERRYCWLNWRVPRTGWFISVSSARSNQNTAGYYSKTFAISVIQIRKAERKG